LEWKTASEINNDYFSIEHSDNGQDFSLLGRVPGSIYSLSNKKYSFIDYYPNNGINYYRLSQTDIDGQKQIKGLITVFVKKDDNLRYFYTNKKLEIFSDSNGKVNVEIYDLSGRIIFKTETNIERNKTIYLTNISSGIYLIKISKNNKTISDKIIIN